MFYQPAFSELRQYIDVVRRRWQMIVIPAVIVLLFGVATIRRPPVLYEATVEYIVGQVPAEDVLTEEQARQWAWIVSQYVVNGVNDWTQGTEFAGRIADRLAVDYDFEEDDYKLDVEGVSAAIQTGTIRSELKLIVRHPEEDVVEAIAETATLVLQENELVIPQLRDVPARVVPIDRVIVEEKSTSMVSALINIPIRVIVSIASGIGLALIMEYVDPKVRSAAHIERMKLSVMGEIPPDPSA